jgi:hypothetical protein
MKGPTLGASLTSHQPQNRHDLRTKWHDRFPTFHAARSTASTRQLRAVLK